MNSILIALFILWSCVVFSLFFHLSNPKYQYLLLLLIGVSLAIWVIMAQKNFIPKKNIKTGFLDWIRNYLPQAQTITLFDFDGKITTALPDSATHSISEFIKKLQSEFEASQNTHTLLKKIDKNEPFDTLVSKIDPDSGEKRWFWMQGFHPIVTYPSHNNHSVDYGVSRMEVTSFLTDYDQMSHHYESLEHFFNYAPFSLIYTNHLHQIIGVNQTFCDLTGKKRHELLGEKLEIFLYHHQLKKIAINHVTLEGITGANPALLIDATYHRATRNRTYILCLIESDGLRSSSKNKPESVEFPFLSAFMHAKVPAIITKEDGEIIYYNTIFSTLIHSKNSIRHHIKPQTLFDLITEPSQLELKNHISTLHLDFGHLLPFEIVFKITHCQTMAYITRLTVSNELFFLYQFVDISERKTLEQQFIQSQKMQAVGQLAGGIAHDFNNILTAIIGYSDLLLQRYMVNDPAYTDIVHIKQNANRATNLVRQLLAFSRQQTLQPKVTDITDILSELSALLRRLIGSGIDLEMIHGQNLWYTKIDIGQIEQVVVNLVVNARDAMNNQGKLIIQTKNHTTVHQSSVFNDVMPTGEYVLLEVSDTGHGIPKEIISHIFDPFFSTKELGLGTGLGLATVYGIIRQTGGYISVHSPIGSGATFQIFLPKYQGSEEVCVTVSSFDTGFLDLTGSSIIVIVEDEDPIRLCTARALREKGYTIFDFRCAEDALNWVRTNPPFDLLITDVVMPHMDGPTLNKHVRDIYPNIQTIFISGYTEDTFRNNLGSNIRIHFLSKPFTLKDLTIKIKEVLNAKINISKSI